MRAASPGSVRARCALVAMAMALAAAACGTTAATRTEADLALAPFEIGPDGDEADRDLAEAARAELAERLVWVRGLSFPFRFDAAWAAEAPAPGVAPARDGVVRGVVRRGPAGDELELALVVAPARVTWRGRYPLTEVGRAAAELARALGMTMAPEGLLLPVPSDRARLGALLRGGAAEVPPGESDDAWIALARAQALVAGGSTSDALASLSGARAQAPALVGAQVLQATLLGAQLLPVTLGAQPSIGASLGEQVDAALRADLDHAIAANPRLPALDAALVALVRSAMDARVASTNGLIARVVARAPLSDEERARLGELPALWGAIDGLAVAPDSRTAALLEVAIGHLARGEPALADTALEAARRELAGLARPRVAEIMARKLTGAEMASRLHGLLGVPSPGALVNGLARRVRADLGRTPSADAAVDYREVEAYGRPGLDPNARDCSGGTLLHAAADRGDLARVRELLGRGFEPLATNLRGETPLHRAARVGALEVARALATGPSRDALDDLGRTPLASAVAARRGDSVAVLLAAHPLLGSRDREGRTALHTAVRFGDIAMVSDLVRAGAPLDHEDSIGLTPLVIAVRAGDIAIFDALVEAGAAIDDHLLAPDLLGMLDAPEAADLLARVARAFADRAPSLLGKGLQAALSVDRPQLARAFVDAGADLADPNHGDLLHVAAGLGLLRTIAAEAARGADLEAKDARGFTPLRVALEADRVDAVRALIRAGASLGPDADHLRPVDRALLASPPNPEMLRALAGPFDLEVLAYRGDTWTLEIALRADPAAARRLYPDGLGLIHHAVRGNQFNVVRLLARRGAPVGLAAASVITYAPPIAGWTPLHFAFAQGQAEMIALLVELGASVEARDAAGREAWRALGAFHDEEFAADLYARCCARPGRANPFRLHYAPEDPMAGAEHEGDFAADGLPLGVVAGTRLGTDTSPADRKDEKAFIRDAFIEVGVDPGRLAEGAQMAQRGTQMAPAFENLQLLLRVSVDGHTDAGGPADGLEPALVRCYRAGAWPEARRAAVDLVTARRDPDSGSELLAAFATQNLAFVDGQLGDLHQARRGFDMALAALTQYDPRPPRAAMLENRAEVSRRLADWTAATDDLKESLRLRSQPGEPPELRVVPLLLQGVVLGDWGHYADAIAAVRDGLGVAEKYWGERHRVTLLARGNLAVLLDALGQRAEARRLTDEQLAALRGLGERADPMELALTEVNAAHYRFVAGELDPALGLAASGVARAEAAAPGHFLIGPMLLIEGDILFGLGRLDEAAAVFSRARTRIVATHGELTGVAADATRRVAEAKLATDPAGARALLVEAWATAAAADAPESRWPIERLLAILAADRGDLGQAVFFGKAAIATLERLRVEARAVGEAFERSFVESRIDAWRELADWLVAAGRLDEATAVLGLLKDDEALSLTTRGAHAQAAGVASVPTTPAEGRGKVALEAQARSLSDAAEALRALAAEDAQKGLDPDGKKKLDAARDRVREARRAFERVLQDIEADLPKLSADRAADIAAMNLRDASALEETLGTLGHGAVLLHYLVGPDKLRILVTTPTSQVGRTVDVATADLNALAFELREALADPHSDPTAVARELYDLMVKPIEADLRDAKAETLMVSLDGVLRYVPMGALWDGERWLVERYAIAWFSRAAVPVLTQRLDRPLKVAALGLGKRVPGFSALPEVAGELEGIVKRDGAADADGVVPGTILMDQAFSRDALATVLEGRTYSGLHIASHFVFEPGTEADSYLLLGDGSHLTLEDMRYELRFDGIDLLSLSACNTALGGGASDEPRQGRELEGFAALTQRLGAHTVLASLWPVADKSTAELMRALYARRASEPSLTKAEALRRAQLDLMRGPSADHAHPYYWAPFVLMGAWL